MRILIVEDDRPSRRLLAANLAAGGHVVVEAEDGLQAWELMQHEHFRMVITDWMMPNLAGPDLIRRIRSEVQGRYIYTIIVTALGDKAHVVDGLAAGADDYITKPYYAEELLARVKIGERILGLEDGLREARAQMEFLAMHDSLTGLFNRRAIQEFAEAELKRATRTSAPISVLLMDLDHFKSVNDQHGHTAGDQALRLFAEILQESIRLYDRIGRWGGEEFLCVMPNTPPGTAVQAAERIRSAVVDASLALPGGETLGLSVSIGVAGVLKTDELLKVDKLVSASDEALYRAKHEGRNRICLAE